MVNKRAAVLFGFFLCLYGLVPMAPTIVAVANAVVPLIVVAGIVVGVLRILWYLTNRYG